jgi:phosphoribosylamine---glycine ligase
MSGVAATTPGGGPTVRTVCLVGSGGREHALAVALGRTADVIVTPGNPGMAGVTTDGHVITCVPDPPEEIEADLYVIGPEAPLVDGLADRLRAAGRLVFGPGADGARLEGSKAFMKEMLAEAGVPSARFGVFADPDAAKAFLRALPGPWVVKTDGLAAGKGVLVTDSREEAEADVDAKLSGHAFGDAGRRVVVEEGLSGPECSLLVLCDGHRLVPLAPAQDFKRRDDADGGPNTGGMGAYSTASIVDEQMTQWLLQHVARPVVAGMKAEGAEYKGILYCGLMMTARGPMVLEFNCRFGDPETQPILMRLESDLLEAIEASIEGRVSEGDFRWSRDASVCVVISSGGYPGTYELGKKIMGLEDANKVEGVKVFHAGTTRRDGEFFTAGGRVLGVTSRAADLKTAVDRVYKAASKIGFEGAHYRRDIAARALKK